MIWVTWRQHRGQALAGLGFAALASLFLVLSGRGIADTFASTGAEGCLASGSDCGTLLTDFLARYEGLRFAIPLFLVIPALAGLFWGAPLFARDIESGTHRFAWTQSVSRRRWAWSKIAIAGAATLGVAIVLTLLSGWWSSPIVEADGSRFSPGVFDLVGVVPVAYFLFAVALGAAAGVKLGKTLPAMGATLGAFVMTRLLFIVSLRERFMSPKHVVVPFAGAASVGSRTDWILNQHTIDKAGHFFSSGGGLEVSAIARACPSAVTPGQFPDQSAIARCVKQLGLRLDTTYHPGARFWTFQWIEAALFLALAGALVWYTMRLIKRAG